MLAETFTAEQISSIHQAFVLGLEHFDLQAKPEALVVWEDNDTIIIQKYFLAKAVQGLSPRSLAFYKSVLSVFFNTVGKHVKDISVDDVRLYIAHKKVQGCTDKTLNNIRRTLSSFYSWCAEEDLVETNPMRKVKMIKEKFKPEKALTELQMEEIRNLQLTLRERAIIEFLYATGCRISEATALNIHDINFEAGSVEVLGKGNKTRMVYLTPRALVSLKNYLNSRSDECEALFVHDPEGSGGIAKYLYRDKEIGRISPDGIRGLFKKWSKKLGYRIHPHLLRKTVATAALKNGMPIEQVQKMLGHKDITTTTIYAQTVDSEVQSAHQKYVH